MPHTATQEQSDTVNRGGFQIFRTADAPSLDETAHMDVADMTPELEAGIGVALEAGFAEGNVVKTLFSQPGFSLTYAWFKSGFPLPLHTHDVDCLYYVVAGSLQLGTETLNAGDGFFVGAHLFDNVTTDMDIYKTEIFGPVLSTVRAQSYEEALGYAMDHEYGNGTAIFTRDGDAARDFANRINVGMIGINVPIPVPLAYHTFGGWKKSVFGDLNQHGPDAFKFYTRTKTVTARWPSGLKDGGEFHFKAMD